MIGLFLCLVASVTDGDTLRCSNGVRVRLAGIDAPETHGCRRGRVCTPGDGQASARVLTQITQGKTLTCQALGRSYDRVLATCKIGSFEPACFMVTHGYAVKRYSEAWRVCRRG